MRYSQSTELALDTLFYMAARNEVIDFSVEQIAQAQHVSVSYLAKVLQQLVKAGLLRSHRGSRGGYALGRQPAQITLRDVAVVFEGSSSMYECNATTKRCNLGPKCLIVATFSEAERKMNEVLERVTLQDIVDHSGQEADWITGKAAPDAAKQTAQNRVAEPKLVSGNPS